MDKATFMAEKREKTHGFTIIELLVVVSIISLLASTIFSSLGSARDKSGNAAVKSSMSSLRTQMDLSWSGTYTGICTDTKVAEILDSASMAGVGNATSDVCNSNSTRWAASVPLKMAEGTSNYWCVDSTGIAKGEASALGAGIYVCP